jgi:hypothetical protein
MVNARSAWELGRRLKSLVCVFHPALKRRGYQRYRLFLVLRQLALCILSEGSPQMTLPNFRQIQDKAW